MNTKLLISTCLLAAVAFADVRVNVRLGAGHPIRRAPKTVIVRRPVAVVRTPVVFAAPVVFARTVVTLPPRDRMVWEDSESFNRREDWVDTDFKVNNTGDSLYFSLDGRAQIDFAEVYFKSGQVQVVDFNEGVLTPGTYRLLDFADGRFVESVRIVARARTPKAKISVLMRK